MACRRSLTPGTCRVTHTDLGDGLFRFDLDMVHPLWGHTFHQSGVFVDPVLDARPWERAMNAVFAILAAQALLGGFDNLWHHELHARLPQHASARRELALHAAREAIYGVVFLALAWTQSHGALAVAAGRRCWWSR